MPDWPEPPPWPGDSELAEEPAEPGEVAAEAGPAAAEPAGEHAVAEAAGEPAESEPAEPEPAEPEPAEAGEAGAAPEDAEAQPAVADDAVATAGEPASATSRKARHRAAGARAIGARVAAVAATVSGRGFTRLTVLPVLLVIAWLLPAVPLLLAGSFALAPMLVISVPLALVLIVIGLRRVPSRWPKSAQAQPGPGDRAPWWSLLGTVAVAAGFAAWQIAENSQTIAVSRDQGTYLQFGYWISQHGSVSIPVSAAAFGGAHPGLSFASLGFVQHGASLSPQFLAGLPAVLAAAFWAGGMHAALLVPPVLGALAVLSFAGLVGRLAGPRWAPAGAVVLAFALPEQYTSRSAFSETLTQILLLGGLCLLIDSLAGPSRPPGRAVRWWRAGPGPVAVLAALGGLALGLTAVVRVDGLSIALPAIPVIGIMFAGRKPQWLPFGLGLLVGAGYGLAADYVLGRPYLDSLASWMRPFGIITAAVTAVTLVGAGLGRDRRLRAAIRRILMPRPLRWLAARRPLRWLRPLLRVLRPRRWLPWAAAAATVLVAIGFAVRPYVQTVRGDYGKTVIAYVGYLQRVAGLPLDPRRLYAEDTLYWVIWYIGVPAVLLGVFGFAMLARRVLGALVNWSDPAHGARVWAVPLLIIGWVTVTVLWRPGTVPDQPWASRRLVPVVLPGLILVAVWAAAWLTGRSGQGGAGKFAASSVAVLCVGALLLPTALTTFGVGVAPSARPQPGSSGGLAVRSAGTGELAAVNRLCAAIGRGASVIIVDPRVANGFTQVIRGTCNTPAAQLSKPSGFAMQLIVAGIQRAHRRPVLLGASRAELARYGVPPRKVFSLATTQDAHELTRPPSTTWPVRYAIWMSQPGG